MNVDNIRFKNPQSQCAGKILNWFNTDSKETFLKNIKDRPEILKENGWISRHIEYKFNSHGLRSEEFSSDESIVFLGCSITVGVGLPYNELYATKIAKKLNLKCYNMAIAASGYDTAYRMLLSYAPLIKPKIVVLHMTFPGRIETLHENKSVFLLPRTEHHPEFYKNWLSTEENIFINTQKNTMAIKHICDSIGAKFVNTAGITAWIHNSKPSKARDLIHPGITEHDMMAETILNYI